MNVCSPRVCVCSAGSRRVPTSGCWKGKGAGGVCVRKLQGSLRRVLIAEPRVSRRGDIEEKGREKGNPSPAPQAKA